MKKIAILHPWLPEYRVSFFQYLANALKQHDVEVDIFYGETPPEWRARNDTSTLAGARELRTRFLTLKHRTLVYKQTKEIWRGNYDLIIVEQAIRNLELYPMLAMPRSRAKIAFWGHGKTYTVDKTSLEEKLKISLTNLGCWFFAYTDAGAQTVINNGFNKRRVTSVRNTIDTTTLVSNIRSVSESQLSDFQTSRGLRPGKTAIYIGGIDDAKRIPFLLEASRRIAKQDPEFRLLIAGDGIQKKDVIAESQKYDYAVYIGTVFGAEKALALASASILMIPGRVGLVAVDSLAAGVPIVTTQWPYHAPEYEYLQSGFDCITSENSIESYSDAVLDLLNTKEQLSSLARNCLAKAAEYTTSAMGDRFTAGVLGALDLHNQMD